MNAHNSPANQFQLTGPEATQRFGTQIAALAQPGFVIFLEGPVGAGKTALARAIIQTIQSQTGRVEDIPSPTFTIVQTYEGIGFEIWHADLYRLSDASELAELGLEDAFDQAFCLIEWPDRLGTLQPDALRIELDHSDDGTARHVTLSASGSAKEHLETLLCVLAK